MENASVGNITQDFYVKCDPALIVKIIRYAGSVDPYRKGRAQHYNQHNEIRSCKFEKTWYDFALYDKHQQLLNCEKESYPISPDDLKRSKNLVRYEIQLKRPSLKEFEHDKLESKSSKFQFGNHALFHYFDKSVMIFRSFYIGMPSIILASIRGITFQLP